MTWLEENGKEPKLVTEQYGTRTYWRWVSPDPPDKRPSPFELPPAVFDLLPGGDFPQPWLYRSRERAIDAATEAVRRAGLGR